MVITLDLILQPFRSGLARGSKASACKHCGFPHSKGAVKLARFVLTATVLLVAATGCVNRQSQMGVENLWRADPAPTFEIGSSTQSQVMDALGPPSQVIALGDQTLFYYLREHQKFQSISFIIYAQSNERIVYDRAIFFFDTEGVLQNFALSDEAIARRDKKSE